MNVPPLKLADLQSFDDLALPDAPVSRAGDFAELTKVRLNLLVLITTLIGYVVAAGRTFEWTRLIDTLVGTGLCAAAASVLNQAIERQHDRKMARTADRPVAAGRMSVAEAAQLGVLLAVCGVCTLAVTVNLLAATLATATVVLYVGVYTPLKRVTTLNTLVGAVPGAVPPLIGYAAASGRLDPLAAGLFAVLFCWQMPHFLAIATLYKDDYAAAGFKMLPSFDPTLARTSTQMVLFGLLLIVASLVPVYVSPEFGLFYTTAALTLGVGFLFTCVRCAAVRDRAAARVAFFGSIIYLPLVLGALMIDSVL
jgi:heme o synthase